LPFPFTVNRNLQILAWNANSILNKKAELEIFLRANSIDVAAIGETKLLQKRKFSISEYKTYRSDRTQFGVMLLMTNDLRHDALTLLPLHGLEATAYLERFVHDTYSKKNVCDSCLETAL
jgi:exonuclease III